MTTIAQLSDLHLVEDGWHRRNAAGQARLRFLSFGRALSAGERRRRTLAALVQAKHRGFDHLVLTGDLTEDGDDAQFEVLAEVLSASGIEPGRVTLVPGNHDAYTDPGAWVRALDGPLRPYAPTSTTPGVVELRDATILPLSTAFHQPFFRSAGRIEAQAFDFVASKVRDPAFRRRPLVIAQHHAPDPYAFAPAHWIDGLENAAELAKLILPATNGFVLHGHTHRETDRSLGRQEIDRVFSCRAVVDSPESLRFYHASYRGLVPVVDEAPLWLAQRVPAFA